MKIGRNNKNSGFSLVELIIVIAIMAIVVTVAGLSVGYTDRPKGKKVCG